MFIFKKHISRRTVLKGAGVTLAVVGLMLITYGRFGVYASIALLINAHRRLTRRSKGFAVVCPPGPLWRVFEVTDMVETLHVFPDRDSAWASRMPNAGSVISGGGWRVKTTGATFRSIGTAMVIYGSEPRTK